MIKKQTQFTIKAKHHDERLDVFLAAAMEVSRSHIQQLIDARQVFVNGRPARKHGELLKTGGTVLVLKPVLVKPDKNKILSAKKDARDLPVRLIAEAPEYLVIVKPAGLLVHPTEAGETDTLADWVINNYPKLKGIGEYPERPGIVHRLDKEASGVMVIARTQIMFEHLKNQFQDRTVEKEYAVLVHGQVSKDHDLITFAIDRGRDGKMVARPRTGILTVKSIDHMQEGKESRTEFLVEKRFARFTLLRVFLHTGRTHQIRVHMFAYNHSVVGDELYINPKLNLKRDKVLGRLWLHARKLCFMNLAGEKVCYEAEIPDELKEFLQELR